MSKLEQVKYDDFRELQPYFDDKSIENGRMVFKIRCQMVDNIPGNLQACITCLECSHWADIKKDLDLITIDDLVTFFQRLLSERT